MKQFFKIASKIYKMKTQPLKTSVSDCINKHPFN